MINLVIVFFISVSMPVSLTLCTFFLQHSFLEILWCLNRYVIFFYRFAFGVEPGLSLHLSRYIIWVNIAWTLDNTHLCLTSQLFVPGKMHFLLVCPNIRLLLTRNKTTTAVSGKSHPIVHCKFCIVIRSAFPNIFFHVWSLKRRIVIFSKCYFIYHF